MRVIKSLLAGALALGLTTSVAVAGSHGWKPKNLLNLSSWQVLVAVLTKLPVCCKA